MGLLPDGPNWSPEGGKCWIKNNVAYWECGAVTDETNCIRRWMPGGYQHSENYSEWSDEQRAAARETFERARNEYLQECEREKKARIDLLTALKRKASPAEWNAIKICDRSEYGEVENIGNESEAKRLND